MSKDNEPIPMTGDEMEVLPSPSSGSMTDRPLPSLSDDRINGIIQLSKRVTELGQAMDTLQRFVLSRALTGDFVQFKSPDGSAYVELVGAGALRIARDLGISFKNWADPVRTCGSDKYGEWFAWEYSCDVSLGNRVMERVEGRCSSRDKFFGYAYGQWKQIDDVREPDVKRAAQRNAMKEGVKLLLGLHRLPLQDVGRLGLDVTKIKVVGFGGGGQPTTTTQPSQGQPTQPSQQGQTANGEHKSAVGGQRTPKTRIVNVTEKKRGKYTIYEIHVEGGQVFDTFDKKLRDEALLRMDENDNVVLSFDVNQYGSQLRTIEPVNELSLSKGGDK
jgi:hypothetical protein